MDDQTTLNVGKLALTRTEAAKALSMSVDSFERHVQPEIRIVRRRSLRIVPVEELHRWLERNSNYEEHPPPLAA